MKRILFSDRKYAMDWAILIMRLTVAIMIITHGWTKIVNFSEKLNNFPDPVGLGPASSMQLAIFAEFFCGILLALGFMTRWALIPLIITMAILVLIEHRGDPFSQMELSLLYLVSFLFLFLSGPGKYSMDHQILKRNR